MGCVTEHFFWLSPSTRRLKNAVLPDGPLCPRQQALFKKRGILVTTIVITSRIADEVVHIVWFTYVLVTARVHVSAVGYAVAIE